LTEAKYTIGIVAEMLSITPQTVRMYEQRGFIFPKRSAGNTRLYSDEDVDTLGMILKLTQDMRVNLAGVEVILRLVQQIQELETEKDHLYKMLYEAGGLLQRFMEQNKDDSVPMRTSMGTLIQIVNYLKL
jgi:MerR family transcriptional regulator, heat shock protein HspR